MERENREKRAEIGRLERRLAQKEEALERRLEGLERREGGLTEREVEADRLRENCKTWWGGSARSWSAWPA
jgi:ribonuclease Y